MRTVCMCVLIAVTLGEEASACMLHASSLSSDFSYTQRLFHTALWPATQCRKDFQVERTFKNRVNAFVPPFACRLHTTATASYLDCLTIASPGCYSPSIKQALC